jgi:hypothetical protein
MRIEWVHEVKVDQPYPGDINTWADYTRLTRPHLRESSFGRAP